MKLKRLFIGALVVLCGVFMFRLNVCAQELQEQTAHISDLEFQAVVEESMASIIESRATVRTINWTVGSNKRAVTAYFAVAAGKNISVSLTLSKSGKVGIIDEDGYARYVTGTNINHSFSISESKAYCVFVQNLNSTAITAKGSYSYN